MPLNFKRQNLDSTVLGILGITAAHGNLGYWEDIVKRLENLEGCVRIAAVGKYTGHEDAYKSINEAFVHAGIANDCKVDLQWIDSEQFETGTLPEEVVKDFDGVLIGPGFGSRGVEGKIMTAEYARG